MALGWLLEGFGVGGSFGLCVVLALLGFGKAFGRSREGVERDGPLGFARVLRLAGH